MTPSTTSVASALPPRVRQALGSRALAFVVFAIVAVAVCARTLGDLIVPDAPRLPRFGLIDFRDSLYWPTVAFLDGQNPYDIGTYMVRYPAGFPFPAYSPLLLGLFVPFALVDLTTGAFAFLALNLVLALTVAWLVLRLCGVAPSPPLVLLLAAGILASRGGYTTLVLGQCTFVVVAGAYLALLEARRRPLLAAVGLAIATLKPTFGVPLGILMLAEGSVAAAVGGGLLAAGGAAIPLGILAWHGGGVGEVAASIVASHVGAQDRGLVNPATSPLRLDLASVVARTIGEAPGLAIELALTLGVLAVACVALHRLGRTRDPDAARLAGVLACVTVVTCIYHQVYDGLLLVFPLVAVAVGRFAPAPSLTPARRWSLLVLLAIPAVNYAMSRSALAWIGRGLVVDDAAIATLASVSGTAIALAFGLLVLVARDAARTLDAAAAIPVPSAPPVTIRDVVPGVPEDAATLARLHMQLLGHGPIGQLGERFLRVFCYGVLLKSGAMRAALAEENGQAVGFIAFTERSTTFHREAFRRRWFVAGLIFLQCLLLDPRLAANIPRMARMMAARSSATTGPEQDGLGEELAIGVVSTHRATAPGRPRRPSVARALLAHAAVRLRADGVQHLRAVVDADNHAALRLYQGLGATVTPGVQGGAAIVDLIVPLGRLRSDA